MHHEGPRMELPRDGQKPSQREHDASCQDGPFYESSGTLKIWCRKKKSLQQELNNLEEQIKQIQMQPIAN